MECNKQNSATSDSLTLFYSDLRIERTEIKVNWAAEKIKAAPIVTV